MEVTIINWRKFNPRKDVKASSWFRMENSLLENPDFYDFSHSELVAWWYIMSLASKKNTDTLKINYLHAERVARLKKKDIESAVIKLQELQCVHVLDTSTLRPRDVHVTDTNATNERTNETRRDEREPIFDFEALWTKYPRKVNKSDARDRFERVIKKSEDFLDLEKALGKFTAYHLARQTEEKYYPHFTTFLGTDDKPRWKDWLEVDPTASQPVRDWGPPPEERSA